MSNKNLFQLMTASLLLLANTAFATLIGTNSGGQLIEINATNGTATQFGHLGTTAVGTAYNSLTDTYYARSFDGLYTFDLSGNVSYVGASGSGITGLTFDSTFSNLFSIDQGNGNFFSVNTATGAASLIGGTGISGALGLSTDSSGNVYTGTWAGDIFTIDILTGTSSFITNVGTGLTSIAFDENDNLFGITISGDFLTSDLLGSSTTIGNVAGYTDIRGLAFNNPAVSAPEPAVVWLIGPGLIALIGLARRKTHI